MAHRPIGSTQTDRVRLSYDAPPLSCGHICQGAASFPGPVPSLYRDNDGMNELDLQSTLHVLVHVIMHIAASVDVLSDTQFVYVPVVMAQNSAG